jgi:hypothetical protein
MCGSGSHPCVSSVICAAPLFSCFYELTLEVTAPLYHCCVISPLSFQPHPCSAVCSQLLFAVWRISEFAAPFC